MYIQMQNFVIAYRGWGGGGGGVAGQYLKCCVFNK